MALTLDLLYSQSNDAKTLTVTDNAGTYHVVDNPTGWETGGATNPDPADIVVSSDDSTADKYHLFFSATVTDKYNVTTVYEEIDLFAKNGGAFVDASDLTWDLDASDFIKSAVAMGTDEEKLKDGVYDVTYTLKNNVAPQAVVATLNEKIVIDGDVRIDVYNKLRLIPYDYMNEHIDTSRDVMEALLAYSYLQAIEGSAAICLTEDLVNMLYTLDKLVSDGSHYTW